MIKDYSKYEMSAKERVLTYIVGYVAVFSVFYLYFHSILLSLLSGVLVYYIVPYVEGVLAQRRQDALTLQFKDMLYSMSASIASGRQMEEALIEAEVNLSSIYREEEPIMQELRHMRISIVENKENDKVLLKDFADRSKNEDINDFVQVYITCRNLGGDLEQLMTQAADVITQKITIDRDIKVLTSQKKTEGRIISMMPPAMLLALNIFSYSYISPLYETPMGRIVMAFAMVMTAYGIYLMEKILDIKI